MDNANAELPLGIKPEKKDTSPCCLPSSDSDQERFPEIEFCGPHATLFMEKYGPLSTNDELTITFRTKIKQYSDGENDYDKRVKLSALAVVGDVVETESDEEDASESGEESKPARKLSKKSAAGY